MIADKKHENYEYITCLERQPKKKKGKRMRRLGVIILGDNIRKYISNKFSNA